MNYLKGDQCYIISNNFTVVPVIIIFFDYDFYIVKTLDDKLIRLRSSRLYPTEETAKEKLPVRESEKKRTIYDEWL